MKAKHPMQPVVRSKDGVHRFKANKIVRFLLDAGPFDMNKLALMQFDREEEEMNLICWLCGRYMPSVRRNWCPVCKQSDPEES